MKPYELIFLDADETLFDFRRAEAEALRRSCGEYGLVPTGELEEAYEEINKALWGQVERGETDQETLKTERFRRLFERLGMDIDAVRFGRTYVQRLSEGTFLLPGAEELCSFLAGKYILAVVTNGIRDVQIPRIGRSTLKDYFRAVIVSEEAGASKPDPAIFEHACRAVGFFDRKRMLMVGDSLASDMRGGTAFGIDTCWFNPGGLPNGTELQPTYEIRSLAELRGIL